MVFVVKTLLPDLVHLVMMEAAKGLHPLALMIHFSAVAPHAYPVILMNIRPLPANSAGAVGDTGV